MSTQVVIPTNPCVGQSNKSVASGPTSTRPSSTKFSRFRPPPKPAIQIDKQEVKKKLTPLQYKVTQEKFTERPFSGEYLKLNEDGIYCCIVCGEQLFSSETKYDSGCGWPAFYNVIDNSKCILQADLSHVGGNLLLLALNQDLARTEVTCAKCGAHLGHVFNDGPKPTGKRYCVNSSSLKFTKPNESVCDSEDRSTTKQENCTECPSRLDTSKKTDDPSTLKSTNGTLTSSKNSRLGTPGQLSEQNSQLNKSQLSRKDFLKSFAEPKSSSNINVRLKTSLDSSTRKTVLSDNSSVDKNSMIKCDMNNNSPSKPPLNIKYSGVKSRYLNHLDSLSKQSVVKHTLTTRKPASLVNKPLLETHL